MTISASTSTATVAYFKSDGTPILDGSQEGDGREYAVVTVTALTAGGVPVQNAQVFVMPDAATPDPTIGVQHTFVAPDGQGPVSYTDASGVATVEVRTSAGELGPIAMMARVGEDDTKIEAIPKPTAATTGATGTPGTTVSVDFTITADGTLYTNTLFDCVVTVLANSVQFVNCTFTGGGVRANCLRNTGGHATTIQSCTFTGATGHAIVGVGFYIDGCYFHTLGLSGVSIADASGIFETSVLGSYFEKYGSAAGVPAVVVSPGSGVTIVGNHFYGPHEDSPSAVAGFRGRGGVWVFSRRPVFCSNIEIARNWIYGGDSAALKVTSLDSGYLPSGVRITNNRFGAASLYLDPAGSGRLLELDAVCVTKRGNVQDETGAPITDFEQIAGAGWYHPAIFIDAMPTVDFSPRVGALATLVYDTGADPVSEAITRFNTGAHEFGPIGQVCVRTLLGAPLVATGEVDGDGAPVLEASVAGAGADDFYDDVPTARTFPPTRSASPLPQIPSVQFDEADTNIAGFEGNTQSIRVYLSAPAVEVAAVTFSYSGSATNGVDYTGTEDVTFLTGESEKLVTLVLIRDDEVDLQEKIIVDITAATNAIIGDPSRAVCRISESYPDASPEPFNTTVQFETLSVQVNEGVLGRFDVALARVMGDIVTVTYSIINSTMLPSEYSDLTAGKVLIPAGDLTGTIVIQSVDDLLEEGTEQLTIRLDAVTTGDADLGTNIAAEFIVFDDDISVDAQIDWAFSTSSIPEGGTSAATIVLSRPAESDITVAWTATATNGLTAAEYVIRDLTTGGEAVSPFVIPAGATTYSLKIDSVDDSVVETTEILTLDLTSVDAGPGELGAGTSWVLSITNNDSSGAGADGDLYGLVPERQTVSFASPDITVTPTGYTTLQNIPLGIPSAIVVSSTTNNLAKAMRAAQLVWELKNAASLATLMAREGRMLEGDPVMIEVTGDLGTELTNLGGGSNASSANAAIWDAPARPFVRDIVVYGATGPTVDSCGPLYLNYKEEIRIVGGAFDDRGRTAANIRFERIAIEGNTGLQCCVRSVTGGDPTDPDVIFGAMKFYNCNFVQPRGDNTGLNFGRGIKWVIRCSQRAAWDLRQNFTELAEEHFFYINSPQVHTYLIGNSMVESTPTDTGGFGRTFSQLVNRSNEVPGPTGGGAFVAMRNTVWNNCSAHVQQGGGDFTIVGFHGSIHLVENMHLGKAKASGGTASGRAAIAVWTDATYGYSGIFPYETGGGRYLNGDVHIWGEVCNFEDGNHREAIGISAAVSIDIRNFKMLGVHDKAAFRLDNCAASFGTSVEFVNGVPSTNPDHGVFWNLAWPNWNSAEGWSGSRTLFPGWSTTTGDKMRSRKNARLWNSYLNDHSLTQGAGGELEVFDGTTTWPDWGNVPEGGWEFNSFGIPLGATAGVYMGIFGRLRSIRAQVWQYVRELVNVTEVALGEVRNAPLAFDLGSGTGVATFTLMDDYQNEDTASVPERPYFEFTPTAAGTNPAEPAVANYRITDFGANSYSNAPDLSVYVYGAGAFGTFAWPEAAISVSVAGPSEQFIPIVTSVPTHMRERITLEINAGLTTITSGGINNFTPTMGSLATQTLQRLISVTDPTNVGKVLVLDIVSVEVGGITAGTVGAVSRITISYTA